MTPGPYSSSSQPRAQELHLESKGGDGAQPGRAKRRKEVLRTADRDGAVRDQSMEEEEGTETERPGAAGAALDLRLDSRPKGSRSKNTRPRPATSSDGKPGGDGRAGERDWQLRGGERSRRCESAPGWGSLTAGQGGTQRPWHLRWGCGVPTRTERSWGDMEGREGESAAKREEAKTGGRPLKRRRVGGRRGGS